MVCVYDSDGDRRRKSATEREILPNKGSDDEELSLDALVSRIRTAGDQEVGAIIENIRRGSSVSISEKIIDENSEENQTPVNQSTETGVTSIQDIGELDVDERGDLRHFGSSSCLKQIHISPRSSPRMERDLRGEWLWTRVSADKGFINELLVSTHKYLIKYPNHLTEVT
jgi:hypothetical protein